ncbi:MAG: tetratricopeptide repeat protein [bacterium]
MLSKEEIKLLFEQKQYLEILQKGTNSCYVKDYLGFLYLETKDYAAAEKFFAEQKMYFQQGFCKLLMGDKASARQIWYSAEENPAIAWGKTLLGILDQRLEAIPSFLQVRNFAEMTLHYFFKSNQTDFAYKLVSAKEFLSDCNVESYKYIGRVLMDNNYEDLAFDYLKKAIDEIPSDAEAYFQLGELYLLRHEPNQALKSFKKILEFNPCHAPAKKKIAQIEN